MDKMLTLWALFMLCFFLNLQAEDAHEDYEETAEFVTEAVNAPFGVQLDLRGVEFCPEGAGEWKPLDQRAQLVLAIDKGTHGDFYKRAEGRVAQPQDRVFSFPLGMSLANEPISEELGLPFGVAAHGGDIMMLHVSRDGTIELVDAKKDSLYALRFLPDGTGLYWLEGESGRLRNIPPTMGVVGEQGSDDEGEDYEEEKSTYLEIGLSPFDVEIDLRKALFRPEGEEEWRPLDKEAQLHLEIPAGTACYLFHVDEAEWEEDDRVMSFSFEPRASEPPAPVMPGLLLGMPSLGYEAQTLPARLDFYRAGGVALVNVSGQKSGDVYHFAFLPDGSGKYWLRGKKGDLKNIPPILSLPHEGAADEKITPPAEPKE